MRIRYRLALAVILAAGAIAGTGAAGADDRTMTLVAVGDLMLGTTFPEDRSYLDPGLRPGGDLARVVDPAVLSILRRADVAFGNLEGTLFDGTGEHKTCRSASSCYLFRSPESYAAILADAGFDVVSLANNHSGDFKEAGRAATRAALARHAIRYAGLDEAGARAAVWSLPNGLRVAVTGFAPNSGTLSVNRPDRAARLVAQLAAQADVVVVSIHAGAEGAEHTHVPRAVEEYLGEKRGDVWAFAHAMIDAGADVVLGHGPHVLRAVEVYRGRFIAYSLGNFWTGQRVKTTGINGVAPLLELTLGADGRVLGARIHSTRQFDKRPRLDPRAEALTLTARLTAADFPDVPLRFHSDGSLSGAGIGAR